MPKAIDIVEGAFRRLNINPAITTIPKGQITEAIIRLNDYMFQKAQVGKDINYNEATNSSDELRTPAFATNWMKLSLATLIAPDYGRAISVELAAALNDAERDISIILSDDNIVYYPANMPVGDVNTLPNTQRVIWGDTSRNLLEDTRRILADTDGEAISTERSRDDE